MGMPSDKARSRADYDAVGMPGPFDAAAGKDDAKPDGLSQGQEAWSIRDVEPVAPDGGQHQPGQLYGTPTKTGLFQHEAAVGFAIVAILALVGGGWTVGSLYLRERSPEHQAKVQQQAHAQAQVQAQRDVQNRETLARATFGNDVVRHGLFAACKATPSMPECTNAGTPEVAFEHQARTRGLIPACIANQGSVPARFRSVCASVGVAK